MFTTNGCNQDLVQATSKYNTALVGGVALVVAWMFTTNEYNPDLVQATSEYNTVLVGGVTLVVVTLVVVWLLLMTMLFQLVNCKSHQLALLVSVQKQILNS